MKVSTRLITLSSPATAITISIYGFHAAGPSSFSSSLDTSQVRLQLHNAQLENMEWAWEWAGGVEGLIAIVAYPTDPSLVQRALECLTLAPRHDIRQALTLHPAAIGTVLDLETGLDDIYDDDPALLLLPTIAPRVPTGHSAHAICSAKADQRVGIAWYHLDSALALHVLGEEKCGWDEKALLDCPVPIEGRVIDKSKVVLLVEAAERFIKTDRPLLLDKVLDLLDSPPRDTVAESYLARRLPRLIMYSRRQGSQRILPEFTLAYPRVVIEGILQSTAEIRSEVSISEARLLAQPFIARLYPSDPLATAFTSSPKTPPTSIPDQITDPTARSHSRFLSHLDDPRPSALVHTLSPSDLINLLAPDLHSTLASARVPPLGIPPRRTARFGAQASDYAGKVYTSHEFRNREKDIQGSVAVSPVPMGGLVVPSPLGVPGMSGGGPSMTLTLGGGIGMAGGRMSRPASRHVDDYVR